MNSFEQKAIPQQDASELRGAPWNSVSDFKELLEGSLQDPGSVSHAPVGFKKKLFAYKVSPDIPGPSPRRKMFGFHSFTSCGQTFYLLSPPN